MLRGNRSLHVVHKVRQFGALCVCAQGANVHLAFVLNVCCWQDGGVGMNEICGEHAGRGAKTYANRNFPATRSDISVWKKFQRDVKPAALQRSNLRELTWFQKRKNTA